MSECNQELRKKGLPYPRRCQLCHFDGCIKEIDRQKEFEDYKSALEEIAKGGYEYRNGYCVADIEFQEFTRDEMSKLAQETLEKHKN